MLCTVLFGSVIILLMCVLALTVITVCYWCKAENRMEREDSETGSVREQSFPSPPPPYSPPPSYNEAVAFGTLI